MAAPIYRLVQRFLRVEAVGMRGAEHGDLADPLVLAVKLTTADDLETTLDEADMATAGQTRLKRLRCGVWAFDLDPVRLQPGKSYSLRWRFGATPQNINVVRSQFVWNPLPPVPSDPNQVVIYGTLADATGQPVPGARLVIEEFSDYATLSHRLSSSDIISDAFGNWHVELPKRALRRFILGEVSKIIRVPDDKVRASLSELPSFQPKDIVRVDRYGYPVPGQNLHQILAQRLSEGEALAVLQSTSVIRYVNESQDTVVTDGDVKIYVHEQDAPSTIWVIAHGKDCTPVVSVIDANNDVMYPDIGYPDKDTVVLSFARAVKGKAVLICGTEHPIAEIV
jgi:hypothetical protein